MLNRFLHFILFLLIATNSIAGNPMFHGTWKGFLMSKSLDGDNKKGLPVSLYIVDDNDAGDLFGEMSIQYRYQSDIYKAKYKVSGNINYDEKKIFIEQEKIIFFDLLPKGLEWCFGNGTFSILRNPYTKKYYLDGYMITNCGNERLRMVLIKK